MTDMEMTDDDIVAVIDSFLPTMAENDDDASFPPILDPTMTAQEEPVTADLVSLSTCSREYRLTGRPASVLYLSCDPETFSAFQVLVRKNVEVFEAKEEDVASNAQGRNKPIVLGQAGIRCIHCAKINPRHRVRGAQYYPSKLDGLYQAAQNLANGHLLDGCPQIPVAVREELVRLKTQKSSAGGGKDAWASRLHAMGVYEDECGLRFASRIDAFTRPNGHHV